MLSWYSESNASRASPFQKRVFGTSQLLSRIGVCLPFAAAIAFAFQNSLLRFLDSLLFSETTVSHFAVLQQQYSFLLQKDGTSIPDPRSFHVFELFIWIASTVGALRVITGLSCRAVLVSSREKLEGGEKSGMSKWKGLMVLLLGGAFGIFCSLNFKFVANTNAAPFIMRNSLRLFLSLETFVFCTSVIFFAEGILAFVSLALIRGRPD